MNDVTRLLPFALAFAIGAASSYCPDPPAPSPTPTPAPTIEPSPTPSPSPEPSPLPTPPPAASPTPTPASCLWPQGPFTSCEHVPADPSPLRDAVASAQSEAAKSFVVNGKVTSERAYTDEVARVLLSRGFCAINGRQGGHTSDDEVWVRLGGESHNFDIVTGDGAPWLRLEARCRF